ncbi:MAG TPA: ABC transporter substrate-binding protein [Thermoleophilaceae bacterium]|nr:ABC transporter substrate-binding protein [Thermoleophilaceae bacterium]
MRRGTAAVAAIIAMLVLAACGDSGGGDGGAEGEHATVKVQDTAGVPAAFLQYGVKEGYFKSRKLDVKVQPSQGGATVIPSVVSGDTDIGGSNLVSVLLAQSKGVPVKIVAPGTFVRTKPAQDFSGIVVAKDSDIRSPKDLEGKTLAVNTLKNVNDTTVSESLRKRGVDPDKIKLLEVDFPDMTAAVEGGRVDAAMEIEPFLSGAVKAGARIIDRPYTGTRPGLQIGSYFASEQYIAENGDVVDRFKEGVAQTAKAIEADQAAFRRFLPTAAKIPPAAAQKAQLPTWKAENDQSSIELTAQLMKRYGVTKEEPDAGEAQAK